MKLNSFEHLNIKLQKKILNFCFQKILREGSSDDQKEEESDSFKEELKKQNDFINYFIRVVNKIICMYAVTRSKKIFAVTRSKKILFIDIMNKVLTAITH